MFAYLRFYFFKGDELRHFQKWRREIQAIET